MERRLRTQTRFDLALGDVCGETVLREAIVDYLRVSRGIDCQPEQVFIIPGSITRFFLLLIIVLLVTMGVMVQSAVNTWLKDKSYQIVDITHAIQKRVVTAANNE